MGLRPQIRLLGSPTGPALLLTLLLLLGPATARAQAVGCSVASAPGAIPFGAYDPTNTVLPATGSTSFLIDCKPKTTLVTISLSAGGGASFTPRAMLQGSWRLEYNLYEDAAMTRIWGDGSAGTVTRTTAGDQKVTQSIYASIPLGQFAAVGGYSDTITMTVTVLP